MAAAEQLKCRLAFKVMAQSFQPVKGGMPEMGRPLNQGQRARNTEPLEFMDFESP
jgi:hypothetical protein